MNNKVNDDIVVKLNAYRNVASKADYDDEKSMEECEKAFVELETAIKKAGKYNDVVRDLLDDYVDRAFGSSISHDEQLKEVYNALCDELSENVNEGGKTMINEENESGNPSIYVGTYAKYNDGDLTGEWVDLTDFSDYDEFVEYCKELHNDESDPEFMVQDYENFPRAWYHESGLPTEDEFYKIQELGELDDNEKKAYAAYLTLGRSDDSIEAFRDAYHGEYTSDSDLGYEMVEMTGMPENPEYYFDYDAFGRDLKMDFSLGDPDYEDADGEPQDPDWYYDSDGYKQFEDGDNASIAEDYIDSLGGIEQLGKEIINNYFDYADFGRVLLQGDLDEVDGYLFWM